MAGGGTDVGVASTAYAARDRDFNVVILRDACRAARKEIDDYFMEHVFPRLGRVRTVDETIALLQASAKGQRTL
jgi:nicotinamidase-related amidase